MKPVLEFWFDFASTYSYLSAMRIEAMARQQNVSVDWRPFLLGPIFQARGWNSSPFNVYPDKGRYMVRDMERLAARLDVPFTMPPAMPANSLFAARIALVGLDETWGVDFCRSVFSVEFGRGLDIAEPSLLQGIVGELSPDADDILERAQSPENKARLRTQSENAMAKGLFGAPSFLTPDGELFWGDDRLEMAVEHTLSNR